MMLLPRLLMISFLILSRLVLLFYPLRHSACGRLHRDSFFREHVWHLYHDRPYEDGIGKEHWFENGVKELRPGLHGDAVVCTRGTKGWLTARLSDS